MTMMLRENIVAARELESMLILSLVHGKNRERMQVDPTSREHEHQRTTRSKNIERKNSIDPTHLQRQIHLSAVPFREMNYQIPSSIKFKKYKEGEVEEEVPIIFLPRSENEDEPTRGEFHFHHQLTSCSRTPIKQTTYDHNRS